MLAVAATLVLVAAPLAAPWVAQVTWSPPKAPPNDLDRDDVSDSEEARWMTNPQTKDSDGDGIDDGTEVSYWQESHGDSISPAADIDMDGLVNVLDPDSDNDGVLDGAELQLGTDPADPDTDGDHVPDGVDAHPLSAKDADGDGLPDDWEAYYGVTDPMADEDSDGLTNAQEYANSTSPTEAFGPGPGAAFDVTGLVNADLSSMGTIYARFRKADGSLDATEPVLQMDPTTPARYMRFLVYDEVTGTTWSRDAHLLASGGAKAEALPATSASYTYSIHIAGSWFGTLPTPAYSVAVANVAPMTGILRFSDGTAFVAGAPVTGYSVSAPVPGYTLERLLAANITPGLDDRLQLEGLSSPLPSELEAAAGRHGALQRLLDAREWLWERAAHTADQDYWDISAPMALASDGRGSSLDFASSLAVLGRMMGVPTRIAVGFAPGVIEGGHRLVRVGDLHAWTEAAIGGYWVPVEATPTAGSDGFGLGFAGMDPSVVGTSTIVRSTAVMGGTGGGTTVGGNGRGGIAVPGPRDTDGDGLPDDVDPDDDNDGLLDVVEYEVGTNPIEADTDHDGLNDSAEFAHNTSAVNGDSDGDGIPDGWEVLLGTDPLDRDTDGAGSCDAQELEHGTDPLNPADDVYALDLDCDGLTDPQELAVGTDPAKWDTDDDGLTDPEELALGTDPTRADSDGDNVTDGEELALGTDPLKADTDADGLADGAEVTLRSDPLKKDTDSDGLMDAEEVASSTDPCSVDSDRDGLSDPEELEHGLDPNAADSDNDGEPDWKEAAVLEHQQAVSSAQEGMVPYLLVAAILTAALAFRYRPFDRRVARQVLDALVEADSWLKGLEDRPDDEVRQAIYRTYEQVCAALAAHGMLKERAWTVREFEDAIPEALPWVPRERLDELTSLFEEARYSDHELPASYVARARECIAGIRSALEEALIQPTAPKAPAAKA
jgi:hypothetical protein